MLNSRARPANRADYRKGSEMSKEAVETEGAAAGTAGGTCMRNCASRS